MAKIAVILPGHNPEFKKRAEAEFRHFLDKGMSKDFEVDILDAERGKGASLIECDYHKAYGIPVAVDLIKKAEKDGYDGALIDCFCDTGLRPGREIVNIPVVGALESALVFSTLLGRTISIVTARKEMFQMIYNMIAELGLQGRIVSVRSVEVPVVHLGEIERVEKALLKEMTEAIEKDNAHVLILGCTGMMGVAEDVQELLCQKGYDVPVVSPPEVAFRVLESLITMGIKQSKLTYMPPPEKSRLAFMTPSGREV